MHGYVLIIQTICSIQYNSNVPQPLVHGPVIRHWAAEKK